MSEERATSELAAIAVDSLLLKMQSVGVRCPYVMAYHIAAIANTDSYAYCSLLFLQYDGNLVRLKTCIALLCGTHEVVRKTPSGLLFLTEKGKRSAQLCPGTLPSPDEVQTSVPAISAAPALHSTSVSTLPPPVPEQQQRPITTPSPAITTAHTASRAATAADQSIVCIDLSDSEDELIANGGDEDDSDASEAETVRAESSPRAQVSDIDDTFSFEYEPDEEPPSMLPSSQLQAVETSEKVTGNEPGLVSHSDEWELVLMLDHREILSRQNRNILERKLLERNVTCEVRALNVGDVQWIAKRYRNGEVDGEDHSRLLMGPGFILTSMLHAVLVEFVLNAIVERKEVKDLSGSIIDRRCVDGVYIGPSTTSGTRDANQLNHLSPCRYTEQKVRLRASGLTHIIYLVEGSFSQQTTVRSGGLQTALCRTQVQNQFFVQVCQNADETVAFLAAVHSRLLTRFPKEKCRNPEARVLQSASSSSSSSKLPMQATRREFEQIFCRPAQSFSMFNSLFRKKTQFTVGEIYQMMLTQVPGFSAAKAAGVSSAHPTFRELRQTLLNHETRKKDERVENIRCGEMQRRLGVKSRESVSYLLTSAVYSDSEEVSAVQE